MDLVRIRQFVLGRAMLVLGLAAALVGAGLAAGIMAYGALVDGSTYTLLSWALIAPAWGLLALFWLLVRRWPPTAAVPLGGLAVFSGVYYGDVYGQFPAGVVFFLATAVVFLPDHSKVHEPFG
ncbi:MAG: hypothetical protein V3S01_06345 [Dehalococcoidia bacterium]